MEWLQAIPYAGAGATILAILQAVRMLRNDNTAKARQTMKDFERWRETALEDAAWYLELADHWRSVAGLYEYEMHRAGITPPKVPPLPVRPPPRIREV